VVFRWLTNPTRFIGDEHGNLVAMECLEMELGEPDASGRRRPVPKAGSEFIIEVDTAVVAVSTQASPLLSKVSSNLTLSKWGTVEVDPDTGQTRNPKIWAAGDVVTGPNTVVHAMGAARRAARYIDQYLRS